LPFTIFGFRPAVAEAEEAEAVAAVVAAAVVVVAVAAVVVVLHFGGFPLTLMSLWIGGYI